MKCLENFKSNSEKPKKNYTRLCQDINHLLLKKGKECYEVKFFPKGEILKKTPLKK
jgi:hypothetical protein